VSDSTDRDKFTIETNNYKNADMLKFMNDNDDEEEDWQILIETDNSYGILNHLVNSFEHIY